MSDQRDPLQQLALDLAKITTNMEHVMKGQERIERTIDEKLVTKAEMNVRMGSMNRVVYSAAALILAGITIASFILNKGGP